MFDGQPFFVRIDGHIWVAPEDVPEDLQCTAMTRRRKRCSNPLDYGQTTGYSYLKVDGGYVGGFDYDENDGTLNDRGRRYLEQRCQLHFGIDAPCAAEPEWVSFVAAEHSGRIVSVQRILSMTGGPGEESSAPTNLAPSPGNDGVPTDVLRPVLDRRDLSMGARGLWMILVSYYWNCEDNRTVDQLHEHRPQDADETDVLLAELDEAGLIEVLTASSGERIVSINPDALGAVRVVGDSPP